MPWVPEIRSYMVPVPICTDLTYVISQPFTKQQHYTCTSKFTISKSPIKNTINK